VEKAAVPASESSSASQPEQWTVTNVKLILCVARSQFPWCCRKSPIWHWTTL